MRASFSPVAHQSEPEKQVDNVPSRVKREIRIPPAGVKIGIAAAGSIALVMLGIGIARLTSTKQIDVVPTPGNQAIPTLSQKQTDEIVEKVSKHIVLPKNEIPQIVLIANVDQLKVDQPFFRVAQNGDQLLVYANRVILYRPKTDQIVDIAQIRTNPTAAVAPTDTPSPTKQKSYATWTPTPVPQ